MTAQRAKVSEVRRERIETAGGATRGVEHPAKEKHHRNTALDYNFIMSACF
jgi:hypothetical protein